MRETISSDASLLHQREPVVSQRSVLFWEHDIATVMDALCAGTRNDRWNVFEFVSATEVRAITNDAIIKKP